MISTICVQVVSSFHCVGDHFWR